MTRRAKGCLRFAILFGAAVILVLAGVLHWFTRDVPVRFPDYWLDLDLEGEGPYLAGAAKVPITPEVSGREGEEVWLAGYGPGRAATGIHDDLWARAVVIRAGGATVAIVAVDLIGLFHPEVIAIRKGIDPSSGVDYVVVSSTHTHSGPDTIGLWGPSRTRTGVRDEYLGKVREAVIDAVETAASDLQVATLIFARHDLDPEGILRDSRKPVVMDPVLSVCEARRRGGGAIATLVNWSCHPEVLDAGNTRITSDFPHALREAVEEGMPDRGLAGLGGVCLFLPGSIGGLQTPLGVPMRDRTGGFLPEASFEKARALGERLAAEALLALRRDGADVFRAGRLRARARTVLVPLQNLAFQVASKTGVIRRGSVEGRKVRTEVGLVEVGPVPFLLLPGEVYPEIVVGGIQSPSGQDFSLPPQEVPPIGDALGDGVRFVIGLANDEIGYLIPKSEWDTDPPYLYGEEESPYGEINSPGPDAAGIIHREALRLLEGSSDGR